MKLKSNLGVKHFESTNIQFNITADRSHLVPKYSQSLQIDYVFSIYTIQQTIIMCVDYEIQMTQK